MALAMPPAAAAWQALRERLAAALLPSGLDIVQPLSAQAYNAAVPDGYPCLPTYGRSSTLALLVGYRSMPTGRCSPSFYNALRCD